MHRMYRYRPALLPIDRAVIHVLDEHSASHPDGVHGYEIADLIQGDAYLERTADPRRLRSNGTVYKSLARLARIGAVTSAWEDPAVALGASRPRRRYYVLTKNGRGRASKLERGRRLRAWMRGTASPVSEGGARTRSAGPQRVEGGPCLVVEPPRPRLLTPRRGRGTQSLSSCRTCTAAARAESHLHPRGSTWR